MHNGCLNGIANDAKMQQPSDVDDMWGVNPNKALLLPTTFKRSSKYQTEPRIDESLLNAYMSSNCLKGHSSPLQLFSTCACQHRISKDCLKGQQVSRIVQVYAVLSTPPRVPDQHMAFSPSCFIGQFLMSQECP